MQFSDTRCAVRRTLLAVAVAILFLVAAPRRAEAKTIGEVLDEFRQAQNALLDGYRLYQSGDAAGASLVLQGALTTLDGIKDDLVDPSVADLLGKKLRKALAKTGVFQERVRGAQAYIENGHTKATVLLGKIRSAWTFGQKAANLVGKPLLAANDWRSAGFHKAGQRVSFRFAVPDGCDEQPQVTVANGGLTQAIDVSSVLVDESRGTISFLMGWEEGGGNVTVSACGHSETMLVYNKGPKIPKGLPAGFPVNLRPGNYRMSYSVNGGGTVNAGTVRLTNLRTFARDVQRQVNAVVNSIQLPGECTKSLAWSTATDNRFSYTFTVTCTVQGFQVSSSGTFWIERI